jgi:hypothetical protein
MKARSFNLIILSAALTALFCSAAAAEGGRRLHLGLGAGGGPAGASSSPTWRAGFEVGFRIGGHWAAAASVSYGALTVESSSSAGTYTAREGQTWTTLPIALLLRYEAPLSDRAAVSLGAGAGYHLLRRTIESETNAYGSPAEWTSETSFHGWAPQAEIGLEIAVGAAFSLTGAVRYEFGVATQRSTVSGLSSVQEFTFGGPSLAVGARFYLF